MLGQISLHQDVDKSQQKDLRQQVGEAVSEPVVLCNIDR